MANQRKTLTNTEVVTVTRYLDEHVKTLKGLPPEAIIEAIKNGTQVEVTRRNLQGLSEAPGLDWVNTPRRKRRKEPLNKREIVLADALLALFRRLGETPPDDLMELIGGSEPQLPNI